jgi:hypothetical protein
MKAHESVVYPQLLTWTVDFVRIIAAVPVSVTQPLLGDTVPARPATELRGTADGRIWRGKRTWGEIRERQG